MLFFTQTFFAGEQGQLNQDKTRQIGDVDQTDATDAIYLADQLLPGELDLSDITRELAKQNKRGSGDDGAEPHFRGLKPCEFTITIKLHNDEQYDSWNRIRPVLMDFNNPRNRNEVSVSYPLLADAGVDKCVVHKISTKRPTGGGPVVVAISCSSVKIRSGSSHTPQKTKAGLPFTLFPGSPFARTSGIPTAAALSARVLTAVQQARLDNNIPFDIARDSSDFPGATTQKQIGPDLIDRLLGR